MTICIRVGGSGGASLLAALILVGGCEASIDADTARRSPQRGSNGAESPRNLKLEASDCVDPDLSRILEGEEFMLCDGSMATGTLKSPTPCAADGATDCVTSQNYPALSLVTIQSIVPTGVTVAGIVGNAAVQASPCAADGDTDCLVTSDGSGPKEDFVAKNVTKPLALAKLSTAQPVLAAPSSTSSDCGKYLINLPEAWQVSTFTHAGKIYFAVPCKYSDGGAGGWHMAFAEWDVEDGAATWIDGDGGTPGVQEVVNKAHLMASSAPINSVQTWDLVTGGDGKIYGVARRYDSGASKYKSYPVVAATFGALSALSLDETLPDIYEFAAGDSSWKGGMSSNRSILYDPPSATFYIYNQTSDAPTNSKSYISVTATSDIKILTLPSDFLLADYSRPLVARHDSTYYMVAFYTPTGRWRLIKGTSPLAWNVAGAKDLKLAEYVGAEGDWDARLFGYFNIVEPNVVGLEVVGNDLYLFYAAGDLDYPGGAPYSAARGIGALKVGL